ncbi:hypothetical protein [Cellulomonas sp. URHB0016]
MDGTHDRLGATARTARAALVVLPPRRRRPGLSTRGLPATSGHITSGDLLRLQRLVGNTGVSSLVSGGGPEVVVQRTEAYDKPAVHQNMNDVISALGEAFATFGASRKKDPDKAALALDAQTRLRSVLKAATGKGRMTDTLDGASVLLGTGGGAAVGLEVRSDASLGDSAVTVAHADGVSITFGDSALTSASRFRSVIFHEFVHALQSADQPDELHVDGRDMWVHNLETVEGPDRTEHLSLGSTPFDAAKVKSLDDKVNDHPGYALNDALREIQSYAYELKYAAATGISAGGAKVYRDETVRNLNVYSDAVKRALQVLNVVRADTATVAYWAGYVDKARALVLDAGKSFPDVVAPKF